MKKTILLFAALSLLTAVFAQWSTDPAFPNLIAGFPAEQVIPKVAVHTNGNVYICRFDNNGGSYNVYLNLLSPQGVPLWTDPNGLLVSNHTQMSWLTDYDMDVDNDGNAVIVFQDIRNAGVNNVVAYKISPTGTFLWGADGVAVTTDTDINYSNMSPTVFNAADNSTYVAWQRLGTTTASGINRLSSTGQKLWGEYGILLSPMEGSYTWPQVTQSDGDNILLKYYHDTGPFWAPNRHVYVMKFSPEGTQLWSSSITEAGGLPAWQQVIPFESDGAGGAILAWYEDREVDMDNDVYCQRVTAAGAITMGEDGALMSVDPSNQQYYPKLAVDTVNQQVFAYFRITDANQNSAGISRQLLDYSGTRLWGETAPIIVNLSDADANPVAAYYTPQGAICLYAHGDNLLATCWRSSGVMGWNADTTLASTAGTKFHFDFGAHPDYWSVLAWEQGTSDMDIYAMRVNSNGTPGIESPAPRNLTATLVPPNTVQLAWQAPSQYILPDSYYVYMNDELGQVVNGDVLSYEFTNLFGGTYSYYVIARYGDYYSVPSETVQVIIVANDDGLIPPFVPNISLTPNPFPRNALLRFNLDKGDHNARIGVFDLKGRKLAEWDLTGLSGDQELALSAEDLDLPGNGIYLIRVQTNSGTRVIKAVHVR
jgi:hypothetical protein